MDALDGRRAFGGEKITVEPARKAGGERGDRDRRDGDRRDGDRDRGDRRERGRGPSPGDKCFKCRGTGHW